jgi:hypothetical protein
LAQRLDHKTGRFGTPVGMAGRERHGLELGRELSRYSPGVGATGPVVSRSGGHVSQTA